MKIIIIGKMPPPIGGVSIHVQRLLQHLDLRGVAYYYVDLTHLELLASMKVLARSKIAHLHTSNPILRVAVMFLCKLFCVKSVMTVHGNLGRYGFWKNLCDDWAIRLCDVPVLINEGSYRSALKLNDGAILDSAYLPPVRTEPLADRYMNQVVRLRERYERIVCTNAYGVSLDRDGREIYNISYLVSFFGQKNDCALIVSDPSGAYSKYLKDQSSAFTNILIIDALHDFYEVLKVSDCFIRYTTTDGDSLSVHEALSLGRQCIATSVVSRPDGVRLVELDDEDELREALKGGDSSDNSMGAGAGLGSKIIEMYESL